MGILQNLRWLRRINDLDERDHRLFTLALITALLKEGHSEAEMEAIRRGITGRDKSHDPTEEEAKNYKE